MDKKTPVTVWRTARPDEFLGDNGFVRKPDNWCFIPSGDPGLTRRIKNSTDHWVVVHKRKKRIEAVGLLADAGIAAEIKAELAAERSSPEYRKKMAAAKACREKRRREGIDYFAFFTERWADAWGGVGASGPDER